MKSIKVCEYSRSRSFHGDLILQDQASGERSQDHWSSGMDMCFPDLTYAFVFNFVRRFGHVASVTCSLVSGENINIIVYISIGIK